MRCTDISLPHNIQCVSVDLWGTLFYDQHYIDKLNSDRIVLLRDVLEKINFNFDAPAEVLLLRERKRFQESEKNGEFLNLFNRIDFLTQHKLSVRDVFSVNKMINHISLKYRPALNYELLGMLMRWKPKYKLALISNTGMISSAIIKQYLKEYGLWNLFDTIIFSEDIAVCKPSSAIYFEASKKLNISIFNILHIGDSIEYDYNAALNACCKAILLEGKEYYESWK